MLSLACSSYVTSQVTFTYLSLIFFIPKWYDIYLTELF